MTSLSSRGWEDLRKQARHLENEIEAKLVALSKLEINMNATNMHLESVPLLDSGEHVFENMASEIESLLSKLILVNEKMSENQPDDVRMLHTIQRHREILKDYKVEFNKTKNNFIAKKNREDLFHSNSADSNYKSPSGLNHRDMYLKENQHIHNSDRLINDQINIAMETKDRLVNQRNALKHIHVRINDLSNKFPMVNNLLRKINLRKRRDSIIIGLVITICTIIILYYGFH